MQMLFDGLMDNPATVPVYRGQWGHPVGFHNQYFEKLALLRGDKGARRILRDAGPKEIAVDDPGILYDIDTPEQLVLAHESGIGMFSN